jgi:molybdopterin molybdotransferase
MQLLQIEEAKSRLLSAIELVDKEIVALKDAHDRVLAEDVLAETDSPPFANSSMDGFAVRAEDLAKLDNGEPIELRVIGDIPAGHISGKAINKGEALRIMTGAPLPGSANMVIPVEDTDVKSREADAALPDRITVMSYNKNKSFVRPQGEDYQKGQHLLDFGQRLRPQDLAILAVNGQSDVNVFRKPRVALLSSGDELVEVGNELAAGKIYESNSFSLSAQIQSTGAEVLNLGVASDDLNQIKTKLDLAIDKGVDIIFSSAGVSVGAYDYLREAVQSSGELDFWRVNMRPGKPLAFGNYDGLPFIGLPGNPVSSFASFEVFGRPALNQIAGVKNWKRLTLQAKLSEPVPPNKRQSYLRARFNKETNSTLVNLTGHQGSGNLYSLVQANCLIVLPANETATPAGELVETWPI